jgi:m7GpppX diphosphatase
MISSIHLNENSIEIIEKKLDHTNDKYSKYNCKCIVYGTLIEKPNEIQIEKSKNENKLKLESYEDYLKLNVHTFDKTWIYNIIDHKKETDTIIFEDDSIIIIPDYKWSNDINELHILGIFKDKNLYSIRELTKEHINILQKSVDNGKRVIEEKYNICSDKLLCFFHYHPSVWQLHIHFMNISNTSIKSDSYSLPRAHLVSSVIENLKVNSDYYKIVSIEVL